MRRDVITALASSTILAAVLAATAASAQSADIIFIDMGSDDVPSDTSLPDSGLPPDAGANTSAADAGPPGIRIEGLSEGEPETFREPALRNPRRQLEDAVTAHAQACIRRHGVDQRNVDIGFLYLVRVSSPTATLTAVTNDEGMHLDPLHVDVLRSVGETRAIDISTRRRMFLECVQAVPLTSRAVVSERLSFRIKRTASSLEVRELAWTAL